MFQSRIAARLLLATLAGSLMLGCTEPPTKGGQGQTTDQTGQTLQTPSAKLVMAEVKDSLKSLQNLQQAAGAKNAPQAGYRVTTMENGWVLASESDKEGYDVKMTRHLATATEDVQSVLYMTSGDGPIQMEQTDVVTKSASRKPGTYVVLITLTPGSNEEFTYAQDTTFTPAGGGTAVKLDLSATLAGGNVSIKAKGDLPDGSKTDLTLVSKTSPAIEMSVKGDITSASGKTIGLDFLADAAGKGSMTVKAAKDYHMAFTMDPASATPFVGKLKDDAGAELGKFEFSHDSDPIKATITYNNSAKAAETFDFTIIDDVAGALSTLSTSIANSLSND
ncbi:hypothetical protein J7643_06660 [bacterium]|nr:hypothetical protein [bacterium]